MKAISHQSCRNLAAFTLLEVLVVMSIVGVLAALVVTGMNAAKDTAERSVCASNLRQLGIAINMYASENDGRYPGPAWVGVPHDLRYRSPALEYHPLTHYIAPYLGLEIRPEDAGKNFVVEAAICPAFERRFGKKEFTTDGQYKRNPDDSQSPFGGRQSGNLYTDPVRVSNVQEKLGRPASQVIALFDADDTQGVGAGEPIHLGGRNYLYLDGHVAWHKGKALPK